MTTENWLPAMAAYEGVSMSCGISALPKRRPILAASARREAGSSSWLELGRAASREPAGAAQAAVPVHDDDDEASLHERIKVAERALLTQAVGRMVREGWSVQDRKVRIGQ